MFRFLFLVIVHCLSAEAASSCENATVGNSRSLLFSGIADLILQGHGYRNLTGVSKIRCGNLCLSNTRCFSFNYSDRDKLCELNGASASQFPQALAEKKDTYYYEPEKLQPPVSDKGACRDPLGMESGAIPDSSLSVSSVYSPSHSKERSRLNCSAGWAAKDKDQNQWIRVDLQESVTVTGIITQGHYHGECWTQSYKIKYSDNEADWIYVTGADGSSLTFQGNTDGATPVTVYFPAALQTRYIQIEPVTMKNYPCMRFELLGCRAN